MGAKKKEEVKTKKNKKEEVVEEKMSPEQERLLANIEALNESGVLEDDVEFDGGSTLEENIEVFMQAVESISSDKEDEIPEEVVNYYNDLVDAAEAKAKEEKVVKGKAKTDKEKPAKAEKKDKKEKDPEKVARGKALASLRNAGPGNLTVMKELLEKKISEKEIYKIFEKRYVGKEKEFIEKRIAIYKHLAKK